MAATGTVVVDGATRLERVSEDAGVVRYAEVYYGWKTGNLFDFAADLSAGDVAEAFRGAKPAAVATA